MKISILVFSPSGNTLAAVQDLKTELEKSLVTCQLLNITGNQEYFHTSNWTQLFTDQVLPHDLLIIAGPVYAHHLHYNVLKMIADLPPCDNVKWGGRAIPFVTYGGISSGIALHEAASLLRKKGRSVPCGIKIASSHKMTRAFLDKEYNADFSKAECEKVLKYFTKNISDIMNLTKVPNDSFLYNGYRNYLKAKLIFDEKKWHECRYPKVSIDKGRCKECQICIKSCPVNALSDSEYKCIHCLNCVVSCPHNAIKLLGDLEKGRSFMNKMIEKHGNKEKPACALYPIGLPFLG